jgi:hypothetical protein
MNFLKKMIENTEAMIKMSADIDVIIKTHDPQGDGYAFVYIDDEGKFDVSYLQDRIPVDAWMTTQGRSEIRQIFEEGKQTWSKENTLVEAIESVFDYWSVPEEKQGFLVVELLEKDNIQLVLSIKK